MALPRISTMRLSIIVCFEALALAELIADSIGRCTWVHFTHIGRPEFRMGHGEPAQHAPSRMKLCGKADRGAEKADHEKRPV